MKKTKENQVSEESRRFTLEDYFREKEEGEKKKKNKKLKRNALIGGTITTAICVAIELASKA